MNVDDAVGVSETLLPLAPRPSKVELAKLK